MKKMVKVMAAAALVVLSGNGPVISEEVKKIQDNSFLLEEAYNQEDGVIQHMQRDIR